MCRGILLLGGFGPSPEYLRSLIDPVDLICAADSGLDAALEAEITPDFILGDMDSLSDRRLLENFSQDSVQVFPQEKDFSDAELGMKWLRSHGCDTVVMVGGGEGRLDHSLALLRMFDAPLPPNRWITAREEIFFIRDSCTLPSAKGSRVSVYPVGNGPWLLSIRGLQWPIDALDWNSTMSLSNRCTESNLTVHIKSGAFLVILPLHLEDSVTAIRRDCPQEQRVPAESDDR